MAHNNLGALYAKLGRVGDAIAEYEAALRIEPNVVEAETGLGNTLWQVPGREAEALQHLQGSEHRSEFCPRALQSGCRAGGHSWPRTGSE